MTILDKGKDKCVNKVDYVARCPKCKCKFTYDNSEIYTFGILKYEEIGCPRCDNYFMIFKKKIYKKYYKS